MISLASLTGGRAALSAIQRGGSGGVPTLAGFSGGSSAMTTIRRGGGGVVVTGMGRIMNNLMAVHKRKGNGAEIGLKRAGAFLLRKSKYYCPTQLGAMKAGGQSRKTAGSGMTTEVTVSYFAEYAPWVHEIRHRTMGHRTVTITHGQEFNVKHTQDIERARGTWWGTAEGGMFKRPPQQQYKFLEKPARENLSELRNIVADAMRAAK